MILGRKFIIWLVSFGVVLAAFLIYRSAGNRSPIEITKLQGIDQLDSNLLDANAGQIGQAKLEYLERARFETIDAKTRKLKRIVGFEKVLHKTGNEWVLDKPYMNIFQDKLRCDVTADTGTVELENVEGSDPRPKSAVMKGNVVIHIIPEKADMSDSFVYLDQVFFDSDRSMLYSDDDVNFVSAQAHLMGKGLEIIYNSITNKLEYLKVKKVDFLNVTGLARTSQAKQKKPKEIAQAAKTQNSQTPVKAQPVTSEPVKAAEHTKTAAAAEKKESFQCLFRDNVSLEYENEVVLAGEVAITDLLWSSQEQDEEQPEIAKKESNEPLIVKQTVRTVQQPAKTAETTKPDNKTSIIATVKCDGPMIIKPTGNTDDYKPASLTKLNDLPAGVLKRLGRRNLLLAQRVSYDYTNEIAKADGQVELVFYPQVESRSDLPFIIDARKGAEFISSQNQVVFYGNVKGTFSKQTDLYDEENIFYGDKLTVDLAAGENKTRKQGDASGDISHIAITGPGVRLESVRTLDEIKLSHVRLKSGRIDYDRVTEDIIATGKGIIEYANTSTEDFEDSSSQPALSKPCYAIIEGFDKLLWDTNSLQVKAFSEKSKGVHIGYLPIEKDGFGNRITIDTRQIDINYFEPEKGKTQLKELDATGGIVYYEQPRYEFVGKDLHLDGQQELLTVSGDKDMPCMLNGAFADAIEYNLKTGSASAVLSGGIGIMPVKE